MQKEELINAIHEKLSINKIDDALNILKTRIENEEVNKSIIILKNNIFLLEEKLRLGLKPERDLTLEKNQIIKSILDLVSKIEFNDQVDLNIDKDEIEILEAILSNLEITLRASRAQNNIKRKLAKLLVERMPNLEYENHYDLFAKVFEKMNQHELRYHNTIRGYTKNIIWLYNVNVLSLLKINPKLKTLIPSLRELEIHLTLWKSKYESAFSVDESVSLVYVGIDEKVGFPAGIEEEIKEYLKSVL